MLPTSEQEISNAKNFAFIPISPKRLPAARLVEPGGQSRIGHYHRQRPTQSKTKSLSDSKAFVLFDADFVPEFGWVGARTWKSCTRKEDLLPGFGVVTDVNAFHQEENILRDIGGMVGQPFQVAGHKHQVDPLANCLGVLFHVSDQFLVNRIAQLIDGVV
jgi:hypothetical protein